MPRPLSYDPKAMRAALLDRFHAAGYAETALPDLEAATGLDRRQLYNAMGDKRAMLAAAIDLFDETVGRRFLGPLEAPGAGRAEIEGLLDGFVALAATPEGRRGCLVCNMAREAIADDPAIRPRVDRYLDRIRAAYANALRGMAHPRVRETASALLGAHVALCVLARAGADHDTLAGIAAATRRLL